MIKSMDTLEIVHILEKNYDRDEAIKLAEAINGKSGLATKEDIAEVRSELKEEIAEVRKEIAEGKTELKEDIAEVRKEIAEVRSELKTDIKWIMGIMITGLGAISSGIIALLITTIK